MNEAQYRGILIRKINALLPGCIILKNDPDWIQGIPDLLILYNMRWAALEVKVNGKANLRPNQVHFVELLDEMSFAAFIYPENEDRVLDDLQFAFGVTRATRIS